MHDRDHSHLANDGFETLSFEADRPFAADRFQYFLEQLPDNVFRAKGVLWIDESDRRYVFPPRRQEIYSGRDWSVFAAEQPAGADRPELGPGAAARMNSKDASPNRAAALRLSPTARTPANAIGSQIAGSPIRR